MGQQQLLLVILGTIVVGISIGVGITLFAANNVENNKAAMINDLETLAQDARTYYLKPSFLGGGGNSYANYHVPSGFARTVNGSYACTASSRRVYFQATSAVDSANTIQVTLQRYDHGEGVLVNWEFSGDFE